MREPGLGAGREGLRRGRGGAGEEAREEVVLGAGDGPQRREALGWGVDRLLLQEEWAVWSHLSGCCRS